MQSVRLKKIIVGVFFGLSGALAFLLAYKIFVSMQKYNASTHIADIKLAQTALHMRENGYAIEAVDSDISEGSYILKDVDITLENKESLPTWCAENPIHIRADRAVYRNNVLLFTHGVKICGIEGFVLHAKSGEIKDLKSKNTKTDLKNIEIDCASKKISAEIANVESSCLLLRKNVRLSGDDGISMHCARMKVHDKLRVEVVGKYTLRRGDAMITGEHLHISLLENGDIKEMKSSRQTFVRRGNSSVRGDSMVCDGRNLCLQGHVEMSDDNGKVYKCGQTTIDLRDGSIQANSIRAK